MLPSLLPLRDNLFSQVDAPADSAIDINQIAHTSGRPVLCVSTPPVQRDITSQPHFSTSCSDSAIRAHSAVPPSEENPGTTPSAATGSCQTISNSTTTIKSTTRPLPITQLNGTFQVPHIRIKNTRPYGGQFAPESMIGFLCDLNSNFEAIVSESSFWEEYSEFCRPQPTELYLAEGLTREAGGASIWLKREDQNEHGTHKTRHITGQLLLARRMGRLDVVADCASAKHGIFTAGLCRRLGLGCVIAMGEDDISAQPTGVRNMRDLGARIISARAPSGKGTLRAAITEALRYLVSHYQTAYYLIGGPLGPSPLPRLVRTFQALLGKEVSAQLQEIADPLPDAVITAIGSGSGAVGLFSTFINNPSVRLIGVEATNAATITHGERGVLHGAHTLLLQDEDGQILDSHSISPDMNISTVGPEIAEWKDSGRIEVFTATDTDALEGFRMLQQQEGISTGLDSAHAVAKTVQLSQELGPGRNVVLLVTGQDMIDVNRLREV
ncbi:uncharacterized protein N7446_010653 [Penicillium canescens]|uniref:tryptophan synthase n=1 Tax=Penicillium canescens TaxID=5083 RepID=A0AAD6N8I6_PENCN|nr:uncharacterized protein N7446_010653 [Penicillium canescens]KAJ6041460.1 hypothetical protein N7460_006850 [Penicillium canescens]KAJ6050544.1 hypothetical protein N7446_010653 [Penicillium canescens]KAJ6064849.1 hypothetical protein N7444_000502 [Penicillium canescens]